MRAEAVDLDRGAAVGQEVASIARETSATTISLGRTTRTEEDPEMASEDATEAALQIADAEAQTINATEEVATRGEMEAVGVPISPAGSRKRSKPGSDLTN